jgi:MraZ protein
VGPMQPDTPVESLFYNSVYRHGVDEKRRVQIPAKWRSERPEVLTLIVWPKGKWTEACLLVLPPDLWLGLVAKLKAMSFSDPKAEALRHLIGKKSDRVTLDKAGRICLPEWMAEATGIGKEAVLVGLVDRFQIWDPDRHEAASAVDDQLSSEAYKLI